MRHDDHDVTVIPCMLLKLNEKIAATFYFTIH